MKLKYCKKHECYYDPVKDVWTEDRCYDEDCQLCSNRPCKPSQVDRENMEFNQDA